MCNFKIKLAEKNIAVECLFESTKKFCKDYLTDEEKTDLSITVDISDIALEKEKSKKERELEGLAPYEFGSDYLETLALYRKIADALTRDDTILFHGSALALDGEAYIFTAKSGTGKSTHTRFWRETFGDRVVMINDDKPLLKITDDGVTVYGTPWCGKHNLGKNISAPLAAIVSLERAKENIVTIGDKKKLFPKILSQTYRTKNLLGLQKTLFLIDKMLNFVNVYELGCNLDPNAAKIAYEGMKGNKE